MHNHPLNEAEAEADTGSKLPDTRTEPLTGDSHELEKLPELQSPLLPTPTPPSTSRSPGRTVRELAHKLSQQNLRLEVDSTAQAINPPQLDAPVSASVPQSISQPLLPLPAISQDLANLPDGSSQQPWPSLEVDNEPEDFEDVLKNDPPYLSLLSVARRRSQFLRGEGSSTGGREAGMARSSGARLRNQLSSQFRDKPITTIANTARVEQMISSGTQCNVQHAEPSPTSTTTPTATSSTRETTESRKPQTRPDYVYSPMELEVDEAYCNGTTSFEEDLSLVEAFVSLRRAGAPGGIRKQVVGGVPLRYQLSADAALRCQTVVKNRPRMRRRKKTRAESIASSAATSAISSPVIPPLIPSPHLNPYE